MPKLQPAAAARLAGGRGRRVARSLAEINVVPLVDVMLVLLIIFMVTAPMIQRGIDVNLPVAPAVDADRRRAHRGDVPLSYRQDQSVYLGDEPFAPTCCRSASGRRWKRRRKAGLSARRRRRATPGTDGRHRQAEGRRRRDGRPRDQDAGRTMMPSGLTMDVTDVLRDRMQEPAGLQRWSACRCCCTAC